MRVGGIARVVDDKEKRRTFERGVYQTMSVEQNVARGKAVTEFLELGESICRDGGHDPGSFWMAVSVGAADRAGLIPVIGSTAAGPAHFWAELEQTAGCPDADERLEELLRKQGDRSVRPAELLAVGSDSEQHSQVSLVQMSEPDELGMIDP